MAITCRQCNRQLTPQQAGEPCPNCGSLERNLSTQESAVAREKAAVAKVMAQKHFQVEPGLTKVIRYSSAADVEFRSSEPIKLLEVNENTVPSGVLPLRFGPLTASGITFPSIIVEVTPDEFEQIQSKQLLLPRGWEMEDELPNPVDAVGGA